MPNRPRDVDAGALTGADGALRNIENGCGAGLSPGVRRRFGKRDGGIRALSGLDAMSAMVDIHRMRTVSQTTDFAAWFAALRDLRARAKVQARIDRAELGNFGDCAPVGEGVSEMRIHYGPGNVPISRSGGISW